MIFVTIFAVIMLQALIMLRATARKSKEVALNRLLLISFTTLVLFIALHKVVQYGIGNMGEGKYAVYAQVATWGIPLAIMSLLFKIFASTIEQIWGGITLMLLNSMSVGDELYVGSNLNFDIIKFGWTRVFTYEYDPRGPGSIPWLELKEHIVIQNSSTGGGRINMKLAIEATKADKLISFKRAITQALLESPMIANKERGDRGACKHHAVLSPRENGGLDLLIEVNAQRYGYDFKQEVRSSIALLILKVMEEHGISQYDERRRFH